MNTYANAGWYNAETNEYMGKRIKGLRKIDSLKATQGIVIAPNGDRVYWAD